MHALSACDLKFQVCLGYTLLQLLCFRILLSDSLTALEKGDFLRMHACLNFIPFLCSSPGMHRPVTSQAVACTYCMGFKFSSLSWIYPYSSYFAKVRILLSDSLTVLEKRDFLRMHACLNYIPFLCSNPGNVQPSGELNLIWCQICSKLPVTLFNSLKDHNLLIRSIQMACTREYKRGKYHSTVDLLFDWFGLVCIANKNKKLSVVIQLIPNWSNRRSIVQWYFPL
jgi:hypothetical protein